MLRYNLLQHSWIKTLAVSRWPLLILRALALGGFVFAILAGLLGTPVGNHNFAIVAVWIGWWAALMLILVPFLGRGWCAVCPIPMPGEWLQNGALLSPLPEGEGPGVRENKLKFPKPLGNIWLQNITFTLLALFSAVILTRPSVTAWVLLGMILLAVGMSLVFERRSFCRYVCPVGGFIGLYSQLAPLELRVIDTKVCKAHKDKSCYQGSENGYGCPWNIYPGGMTVNTNCGLCMECLRTCEYDNIALNLRAFGTDIHPKNKIKLDEAYKAFIMLGSALVYSAVMLGPWGALKDFAYQVGSLEWMGYALALLVFTWVLLPGSFYLATFAANRLMPTYHKPRQTFTAYATALLPLGLAAWVAFSFSFVFANISYLWPTLSDPFGWGWNLFGTTDLTWTPYLGSLVPSLQVLVLVGGLFWSGYTAQKIAAERDAARQAWAVMAFSLLVTLILLWLLVA